MLRSLNISDGILGNEMQEIPINHERLHRLKLTKCHVVRISIRCPQLQTLSLKRSNMAQTLLNCPLLRVLDIGSCHKLTDAAVRSAVTACPQLESLDMSNCTCASDETLREIAQYCVTLHILNASYCPNISLESVRLPMLTVLKLHSCEGITSASMAAIAYSTMLEVLELDNSSLLTAVSLELPRLQIVKDTSKKSPMELINEVPPIKVEDRIVACEGEMKMKAASSNPNIHFVHVELNCGFLKAPLTGRAAFTHGSTNYSCHESGVSEGMWKGQCATIPYCR